MARWEVQHWDTTTLEERRLQAGSPLHSGVPPAEVARRLAVSPAAVCKWNRALEERGSRALRAVPRPGRPPNVPRTQLAKLPRILARGALSYGFSTELWTILRTLVA